MVEKISKRYIISLFVTIIGLIGLISGTSYAILKGNTQSNNIQIIKAGSVQLQLEEKYNNIEIGSFVLKDADGLMQDETYDFTITNIGSVSAKYDLKLLNTAPSGQTALSSDYIRIGLEVNGQEMGPMGLGNVNNIIDSNTINENEIVRYKMRIWLDKTKKDEIEQNSDKKAYLSLKVEAKQSTYAAKKYVYRYGENWAQQYNPLVAGTYNGYCDVYTDEGETYSFCTANNTGFITLGACQEYLRKENLTDDTCEPGTWTVSTSIPYTTDATTLNESFYLKYNIGEQTEVLESYVCYVINDNEYCLRGGDKEYDANTNAYRGPSYETNKQILINSFGATNCEERSGSQASSLYYACENELISAGAGTDSAVSVGLAAGGKTCTINNSGASYC